MRVIRVTTGKINWSSSKPRTFLFCIYKYRRAASCVHLITVLKLRETRATVPNLEAMFVDMSLRFYRAPLSRGFLKIAPLRDFETTRRAVKKLLGLLLAVTPVTTCGGRDNNRLACVASVSLGFPCRFRCFGREKTNARPKKERGGREFLFSPRPLLIYHVVITKCLFS